MERLKIACFVALLVIPIASYANLAGGLNPEKTATGISLNTEWKRQIYDFAKNNILHPSWGIAHSERDYQVTLALAKQEGLDIDEDVLFASSFLHDIGGISPFDKKGVDHAIRSVEIVEPLLLKWKFPMKKWPQVKEMILGHVYYKSVVGSQATKAFRDADILDFLGVIGVARIFAITLEPERASMTLEPMVKALEEFAKNLPEKCSLTACKEIAAIRKIEMEAYIDALRGESFRGQAL